MLHEHLEDKHRQLDFQSNQPWNRGAGSVADIEVEEARGFVEMIERWQRQLTER